MLSQVFRGTRDFPRSNRLPRSNARTPGSGRDSTNASAIFRRASAVVVLLVTLTLFACRSSPAEVMEATLPPTAPGTASIAPDPAIPPVPTTTPDVGVILTPTPTPLPTPTQVTVAEPVVRRLDYVIVGIDAETFSVSTCKVSFLTRSSQGFNTAPAPTSVPSLEVTDRQRGEYWLAMNNVLSQVLSIVEMTARTWELDMEVAERAALLADLSGRWAFLCDATADVPTLQEFNAQRLQLAEQLLYFGGWIVDAASSLRTSDGSGAPELIDRLESSLSSLQDLASNAADPMDYGVVDSESGIRFSAPDGFEVIVAFPVGWVVTMKASELVLANPSELKFGLGESILNDRWTYGTAIRVRRLRNPSPTTAGEASQKFALIRNLFGEASAVKQILIDGFGADGYRSISTDDEQQWVHVAVITVAGTFTYIIEGACSTGLDSCPNQVEGLLGRIAIVAR